MLGFKLKWIVVFLWFCHQSMSFANAAGVAFNEANPPFKRGVWLWLENATYSDMIQQPYIKTLLKKAHVSRANQYSPVSTVLQANGFALIAGDTFGVSDNELTKIFSPSLVDLMEAKKVSWKVYAEDYPEFNLSSESTRRGQTLGNCFLGAASGTYRRARVPFMSLARVQANPMWCNKITSTARYFDDLQSGQVPQLSVVIPAARGTPALESKTVEKYLNLWVSDAEMMKDTVLLITTTQVQDLAKDRGFFLIMGPSIRSSYLETQPIHHYHVLRTLLEGFGLGSLNAEDSKVSPLRQFWLDHAFP